MELVRRVTRHAGILTILVVALAIGTTIACSGEAPVVSAQEMERRAQERRDALMSSLTEGRVLYMKTTRYSPNALGMGTPDYPYPERVIDETWMMVGEEGILTSIISKAYDPNGALIATSTSESSGGVFHDLIADETMEIPDMTGYVLADAMGEFWRFAEQLEEDGYAYVRSGTLNGEDSAVYSRTYTQPGGDVWRYEIEMAVNAPLLHRQSVYEVADGVETLLSEDIFLDYSV